MLRHRGQPGDAESLALVDNTEIGLVGAESIVVEHLLRFAERNGY